MTWEPRPIPEVTPETERYWRAAAEGTLLVRACTACGFTFHYPRAFCPECFSPDVEWRDATGEGTVYSFSPAYRMSGWPEEDLPLLVAYVELDEGPRIITNIDADPDEIEIGSRVRVKFVDTDHEDVGIPVFEPIP